MIYQAGGEGGGGGGGGGGGSCWSFNTALIPVSPLFTSSPLGGRDGHKSKAL